MRKGQVEQQKRVDSYRLSGTKLLAGYDWIPFQRGYNADGDEVVLIGEHQVLLSSIYNAAGRMTYFRCPWCGQRVRFLYLPEYKCRACANLNYRSQQLSKKRLAEERRYAEKVAKANDPISREIAELEHKIELLKLRHKKA